MVTDWCPRYRWIADAEPYKKLNRQYGHLLQFLSEKAGMQVHDVSGVDVKTSVTDIRDVLLCEVCTVCSVLWTPILYIRFTMVHYGDRATILTPIDSS